MDAHFHFNAIPKPNGTGATTRIVFQAELTPAEIYAAAATESGLTAAQVETATAAVFRQIIIGARRGRRARRIGTYFSFTPRCGGSFPTTDFDPTVENMNLDINAALAPEGDALFHTGITFHRDGTLGDKTPEILRVYDASARVLNVYSAGGAFRISGHDFGPEPGPSDTATGIFLEQIGGSPTPVRVVGYSGWSPSEVTGAWPAAATGSQELRIVTRYPNTTELRTFIWPAPIVPSA